MVFTFKRCFAAFAPFALLLFLVSPAAGQRGALEVGPQGYASAPDSPSLSAVGSSLTLELWFQHDGTSESDAFILDKRSAGGEGYELHLVGSGEEVPVQFASGEFAPTITSESGIPAGVWTHVAVVYDGSEIALYLNGELDVVQAASGGIDDSSTPLRIGTNHGGTGEFFSGQIDELRLWSTPFSLLQIRELMYAELDGKSGLLVHYPFNGGSTALQDVAGGNDLSLIGDARIQTPGIHPVPPHLYALSENSMVELTWEERLGSGGTNSAAQFRIYRSSTPNGSDRTEVATIDGSTTAYTDTDVDNGTTYYYEVTAINDEGAESGYSKPAVAAPYSIRGGGSLLLSGAGYGSISDRPSLSITGSTITVEAWLKHDGNSDPDAFILDKRSAGGKGYELHFVGSGDEMPVQFASGDFSPSITSQSGIPAHVWTHVAVVYDGNEIALYINGELDASQSGSGEIDDAVTAMRLGANEAANSGFFSGQIDELRLWNTARTAAEVSGAYRSELTGSEEGLVGYWRFNEVGSNVAHGTESAHQTVVLEGDATLSYGGAVPLPPHTYASAGNGSATVTWIARQTGAAQYTLYRSTWHDGSDRTELATTAGSISSYTDTGVENGTTYFYEVTAMNSDGQESDYAYIAPAAPSEIPAGHALQLDGAGAYATVADRPSLSVTGTQITIEAWIRHDGESDPDAVVLDKRSAGGEGYELVLVGSGDSVPVRFGSGDFSPSITSNMSIPADAWTHVAVVYDGNEIALYLNGELDAQQSANGEIDDGSTAFQFGANEAGNGQFFSGQLDEVRIWDTARSQDEIAQNFMTSLQGHEDGLVAYWRFDPVDDGSGTLRSYGSTAQPMTAVLAGNAAFSDSGALSSMPRQVQSLDDLILEEDFGTYIVADLDTVFADEDTESLSYSYTKDCEVVDVTIDADSRLVLTSIDNAFGVENITVTAADHLTSMSTTFAATVASVNDVPNMDAYPADVSFPADGTEALDLFALTADVETKDSDMSFAVSTSNAVLETHFDTDAGELQLSAADETFTGDLMVTVEATDEDGAMTASEIAVTITTPTSIERIPDELPSRLTVEGNYPNPFTQRTAIRYGLPTTSQVTLTVYNALGRAVATPIRGKRQQAGWYEVNLRIPGVSSGTYVYRLHAGSAVSVGTMTVVR